MEDNQENETGYVTCAQCGATCQLASVPQIATDCTTMEATQAGSTLDVVVEPNTNKAIELSCDWTEPEQKRAA